MRNRNLLKPPAVYKKLTNTLLPVLFGVCATTYKARRAGNTKSLAIGCFQKETKFVELSVDNKR
jgi:hypothetical protein